MAVRLRLCVLFLSILLFVHCGYPPQGDEVQMGSVLLPATRRGRYLANIVRRQAVDGTGIKFNKDADRMNAEAKKKVDVLSEELLPYIIAEQERRTTLYKRVMTAIQNGEKGVTIAEIRNKPPLIIRKGLMYRCPANRAPKEPDGSGVIMCESEIEPTPVMYDSCLSAEDKELYVADSRYFFCNRHKVEGPDLPRNGSTVIGCAPLERTSLNYTTGKCALEDTDDVVVHYRYYPDKTYKFVTELDPDHEVCDHWNPCQIGYIYSLPSPDQAMPANELWHDYEEKPDEYEKDEIVPPIPEDNPEEYVPSDAEDEYATSPRKIVVPDGFKFHGIGRFSLQNIRTRVTVFGQVLKNYTNIKVKIEPPQGPPARRMTRKSRKKLRGRRKKTRRDDEPTAEGDTPAAEGETPAEGEAPSEAPAEAPAEGEAATEEHPTDAPEEAPAGETSATHEGAHEGSTEAPGAETAAPAPVETGFITIQFFFKPLTGEDMTHYYARFESKTQPGVFKYRTIVILHPATIPMRPRTLDVLPGQLMNATRISIKCGKCLLKTVMVRAFDGGISNLDTSRYRMRTENERKYIEIDLGKSKFQDFGDYFVVIQTEDGNEERIKALSINGPETSGSDITCSRQTKSVEAGTHVDHTVKYDCNDCLLEDVLCEGETVITSGRVSIVTASKFVSFNFPSFENENACVYIGLFQAGEKKYKRILSVVDNASPAVNLEKPPDVTPPPEGTQFEHEIPYSCEGECSIEKITLNGVPLEAVTRRSSAPLSGTAFYTYSPTTITLRITSFSSIFMGVYQALFNTGSGPVTKTILEIKDPNESSAEAATTAAPCSEAAEPAASHAEEAPAQAEGETTAAAEAEASAATEGDAAVPAEGETPAPAEGEAPAPAEGETPAPAEGEAPAA